MIVPAERECDATRTLCRRREREDGKRGKDNRTVHGRSIGGERPGSSGRYPQYVLYACESKRDVALRTAWCQYSLGDVAVHLGASSWHLMLRALVSLTLGCFALPSCSAASTVQLGCNQGGASHRHPDSDAYASATGALMMHDAMRTLSCISACVARSKMHVSAAALL